MKRPKVITKCVADHYVQRKSIERIVEISFPNTDGPAGGLISLRYRPDGPPIVELYRFDGCEIRVPHEVITAAAADKLTEGRA